MEFQLKAAIRLRSVAIGQIEASMKQCHGSLECQQIYRKVNFQITNKSWFAAVSKNVYAQNFHRLQLNHKYSKNFSPENNKIIYECGMHTCAYSYIWSHTHTHTHTHAHTHTQLSPLDVLSKAMVSHFLDHIINASSACMPQSCMPIFQHRC